jgi:hypothetical protein
VITLTLPKEKIMAEPVALGIKPPQPMSLGDMLNLARGTQAYQQAEQTNPLALQKAQMEIEQLQKTNPIAAQKAALELSTLQQTQPSTITKAAEEAKQSQIGTQSKQLDLDQSHFNLAGNILSGLESRAQSLFKKGDTATALKELKAAESWMNASGIPSKEGGATRQAEEQIKKGDFTGYLATLENMRNVLGGAASRYQANLPSLQKNASGEVISANPLTNKMEIVRGAGNINPTSADVELGSEYQKGLSSRVTASNAYLQRAQEIEPLLEQFKPGAGTGKYADIAQKLQAVGAPQALVDKVAGGDLSAVQSMNKFLAQSVIASARQAANGSTYASEVENFLKNNPSVDTDPRALKRFIQFNNKLARVDLLENEALAQAKEKGIYNPGTWQADFQKIAEKQGLLPKTPTKQESGEKQKEQTAPQEKPTSQFREGQTGIYNGKKVIYKNGAWSYQ